GQRDDRRIQFLGQRLQTRGDLGDFLHAVLARLGGRALHELDIVDDDNIKAALALETTRTGSKLRDGNTTRLVDEERDFLHHLRAGDQLFKICLGDLTTTDL